MADFSPMTDEQRQRWKESGGLAFVDGVPERMTEAPK